MKVLLKRNFSAEGRFFLRQPEGTEIPSVLNGRKVVAAADWDGKDTQVLPLPDDAEILSADEPVEAKEIDEDDDDDDTVDKKLNANKPTALSEITKSTPSAEALLAKKA